MTRKLKTTVVLIILGILLLVFAVWYKYEYSMDFVEPAQYNSSDLQQKILIATQGSKFKNIITKNLIEHYQNDSIFIKVIDVTLLPNINPTNYKALVIIHTWENWKPQSDVQSFIENTFNFKDKIIVLTTSGKGSFKIKDIDALTGESNLKNTGFYTNKIIERLDLILKN